MSLQATNSAYELARVASATREQMSHPAVDAFARSALQAWRHLKTLEDDDYWMDVSRALWRVRRDVAATPVALNELSLSSIAEEIDRKLEPAAAAYPTSLMDLVSDALSALQILAASEDNPVGSAVAEVLSTANPDRSALLVESAHRLSRSERFLQGAFPTVRVLVERELAASGPFETIVVVGPSEWFKPSLLLAPQAEMFCFLTFGWMRDRPHEPDLFSDGHMSRANRPIREATQVSSVLVWESSDTSEIPKDLPLDWVAIGERGAEGILDGQQLPATTVDAFPIALADQRLAFVEVDSRIDVVIFHPDGGTTVSEKPVGQLAADDFIVLRGDDATVDYRELAADRLLGEDADRLRKIQSGWKERLRTIVHELGWAETDRRLRAKGLRVKSSNLSYRMAPHSFRTRDQDDFAVFMDLVGLGDRTNVIWKAMGKLESAHRRAGAKTRQRLEDRLDGTDLTSALRYGRLDITLENDDAGSLAILAVVAIGPETVVVPFHRARRLVPLEGAPWHD